MTEGHIICPAGQTSLKKSSPYDCFFLARDYKKDIFAFSVKRVELSRLYHGDAVYIIKDEVFVYHQHEVLYIIKPPQYTLTRDDIQPQRG